MQKRTVLNGHISRNYITHWSPGISPVLHVSDGETFAVDIPDSSTDQIRPDSKVSALRRMDSSKTDAAVGPIYVEDAMPGDTLRVDIAGIECARWGWSAIFPGFGLLSDEFNRFRLFQWSISGGYARPKKSAFLSGLRLPVHPFPGVIGVLPLEESDEYGMIPPQYFGGNMDNNRIGVGSSVYFRVNVKGAGLCIADTHAAQGDGEVCGTAIETPSKTTLRVRLFRDGVDTRAPAVVYRERSRSRNCLSLSGIAPDLHTAAKKAVRSMVDLLNRNGLGREESYLLCSVAADLRISEIVDSPNWNVGISVDTAVLRQLGVSI